MVTETILSNRVNRLKEELLAGNIELSCERIKYLLESYRETQGLSSVIRQAHALERILLCRTIYIDENPIVGTLTEHHLGVQPYPENFCDWMATESGFRTALGQGEVSEENAELLHEAVDYWKGKDMLSRAIEIWSRKYPGLSYEDLQAAGMMINSIHPRGRVVPDYGKVLNKGLNAIIKEAEEELAKLTLGSLESLRKEEFLKATVVAQKAVIAWANRYAELAEEMAQGETNEQKKQELERIAQTCQWIPANPAKTFSEALQSFWFIHLAAHIEHLGPGIGLGRFTQYMYPFYQKDKELGIITDEEVIELLELLYLKISGINRFVPAAVFQENQGSMFQNISLGGVTSSGQDATNKLDFLVIEAQKRVRLTQPTLSVLYHDKLSEEFLLVAEELIRTGIGMPAFFNSDLNIQRLIDHGATLEEARDHCIVGCVEAGLSHASNPMHGGALSMAKVLELTLNNGLDPRTGKQIGLPTGDATAFKSFGELETALRKQLQYFIEMRCDFQYTINSLNAEFLPLPFTSALVDDCIKAGKSMGQGGAKYSMDGFGPVGTIDLADSLYAIKNLVFEEKRISMAELLEALRADFEGKDELYRMLLAEPKYGNDGDYVEPIARTWYDIFYEEHQKFTDHLGRRTRPYALSVSWHGPFGAKIGALPSGRKAKEPLADGSVSPSPGQDTEGPTAVIWSASKVLDTSKYAASLLNLKFHPSALGTEAGLRKLTALIKTYLDLGGHHVQFNIVSADTLKDAKLHPENYRDLIVRVAGFSAFFVHLEPRIQDEIIKRSQWRL